MKLSDFDFSLPADRIASRPSDLRDQSRLLIAKRDGSLAHQHFRDITGYLDPGDMLLINDTKVFPARLIARKATGGVLDILLTSRTGERGEWNVLYRGNYEGNVLIGGSVSATVWIEGKRVSDAPAVLAGDSGSGELRKRLRLLLQEGEEESDVVWRCGAMPLPPYIKRLPDDEDRERYQTVYAEREGSIAAPTAGLHFTETLLSDLRGRGVKVRKVTLHVGPGTFRPMRAETVERHRMESERFEIRTALLSEIDRVKGTGKRLITVGTTTTRAIEGYLSDNFKTLDDGRDPAGATPHHGAGEVIRGETSLFIYPGYRFRAADGILTNFHLPRSTPLMLASAFLGRERLAAAYQEAISLGYRFFSYGDAMLML